MPTVIKLDHTPQRVDVDAYRGDDTIDKYQFKDPTTGDPIDITTWTLDAQIRPSKDDDTILVTLTVDKVDAPNGRVQVILAAVDSAQLEGAFVWDLQRTLSGLVRTVAGGKYRVVADVTRAP